MYVNLYIQKKYKQLHTFINDRYKKAVVLCGKPKNNTIYPKLYSLPANPSTRCQILQLSFCLVIEFGCLCLCSVSVPAGDALSPLTLHTHFHELRTWLGVIL